MNLNFTPFPTLSTQRLRLRQLNSDDAEAMFAIRSHPIVHQYLPHFNPKSLMDIEQLLKELAEHLLKNNCVMWAITLKENSNLIGTTCLWNISKKEKKADIGYDLHPDFHHKGIMQEAITAVLKYGFETVEFDTIEAMTHRDNQASVQLLMKNNFEKVAATPDEMLDWPDDNQLFFLSKKRYSIPKNQ